MPSQRWGEAEGSLIRETPVRVGAALTTLGRASTARWRGPGQRDEKVHARNRCLTLLNGPPARTWRIWAGRGAHPVADWRSGNFRRGCDKPSGGHGECLRRSRGDAAGVELGASLVDRLPGERGNRPASPSPHAASEGAGQVRRLLMGSGGAEAS